MSTSQVKSVSRADAPFCVGDMSNDVKAAIVFTPQCVAQSTPQFYTWVSDQSFQSGQEDFFVSGAVESESEISLCKTQTWRTCLIYILFCVISS